MNVDDHVRPALEETLAAWTARAEVLVDRKVADARAHAGNALTLALKATEDGRPTARRGLRSRSLQAALDRLDELLDALCGRSEVSLRGLVRDARADLYRTAFFLHRPLVPADLHISPDPAPTARNLARVRAATIHGLDPRLELAGPIDVLKRALRAAVTRAAAASADAADEDALLDGWAHRARAALLVAVATQLGDALVYAEARAARDLVHPDYLEEPDAELLARRP